MRPETIDERHYRTAELAELWGVSSDTIRELFMTEPGVVKLSRPGNRYKRSYTTLLIPESVMRRVYQRMQVAA